LEKEIRPRPILTEQLKTHVQRKPALKIDFRLLGTGGVILLLLIIGGFGLNYLINNLPVATAAIPSPTNIATLKPSTSTIIPFTSTPQPTKTLMPTPTLEVRSTEISPKDGMALLYVPAGDFLMGSTDADSHSGDEKPQHTVYLGAFWVDRTEVNNKMYSLCVNAGVCSEPANIGSFTRSNYFGNSQFDDYPVIYVDWNMAKDYCEWAGRRLPTEAEWEKAARGTEGWVYPWGGYDPNEYFLNYDRNVGDTSIGGDMSSIYGVYNMVGNVWEWVSSLYEPYPYSAFDGRENLSGSSGPRVIRGGSWNSDKFDVRTANREWQSPLITSSSIGFRCVRSP
jgi:formylglycine-generating enzyme required for sulfatase activity